MRRVLICLVGAGLLVCGLPAGALGVPRVTFKVKALPIPGFPHTGFALGAGVVLRSDYTISGSEYEGFPPPLIGVNFFTPAGARLHPQGFPTCSLEKLKTTGSCPKSSQAGPVGHALSVVAFGGERVREEVAVQPYFAPQGGLEFYTEGKTPTSVEIISTGHFMQAHGLFAEELISEIPLIETVPGAPYVSVERISIEVGAAFRRGSKTIYYGTVPKECPKKGFPIKTELVFAAVGGLPSQTVTADYNEPCPRR